MEKSVGYRGRRSREILPDQLRLKGASVDVIPVYKTVAPSADWAVSKSSSGRPHRCHHLHEFVDGHQLCRHDGRRRRDAPAVAKTNVACIGPVTAHTAEEHGLTVGILPTEKHGAGSGPRDCPALQRRGTSCHSGLAIGEWYQRRGGFLGSGEIVHGSQKSLSRSSAIRPHRPPRESCATAASAAYS